MSVCPHSRGCQFYLAIEPSVLKRIKFASAYPYCKGGRQDACVLRPLVERGAELPADLLPDGTAGEYLEAEAPAPSASIPLLSTGSQVSAPAVIGGKARRFLVVENSPVFATLAANVIKVAVPGAQVAQCASFDEACAHLREMPDLIVSGYGLGEGRTVHDLRRLTAAPIVLMTGRPGDIDLPSHARLVEKSAGPEAIRVAISALIG